MNGNLLITKLLGRKAIRENIGCTGDRAGDVSKQVAIWAMAIKGQFNVDDMVNADLPYAPTLLAGH